MPDAREFWTAERVALLRRLRDDGLAYAAIGARLGVTRSAISGKVDRLGLAVRERLPRAPRKPRPMLRRRPVAADPALAGQADAPPEVTAGACPANQAVPPPGETVERVAAAGRQADAPSRAPGRPAAGCGLLDLNEHTCRWPIGDPAEVDFLFCGELPQGGGPYCAAHRRLAYRPADPIPVSDFEPARRPDFERQPDSRFGQFADWDVT